MDGLSRHPLFKFPFLKHPFFRRPGVRASIWAVEQVLYLMRLGLTHERIGNLILSFLEITGGIILLLFQTLYHLVKPPYRFRSFLEQAVAVGWSSLPLIAVTLGSMGMIVMLELEFQMSRLIRDIHFIPGVAGVMFFREFGAVVVSAMLAAKVGAGITAEIGSMKATDQIDALELMGISPIHYLVVPRFAACMVMQMALSIIGLFCAFFMGHLASRGDFNYMYYLSMINQFVGWPDFVNLFVKALALGWVVPIVSSFYGLRCRGGARGVGESTTKAVVMAILLIIVMDFAISVLTDKFISAALSYT